MSLRAEHLTLAYRGIEVVRDVSLEIAPGEFVAIVGPNAGGKSTLLRGLGRAMTPASGRVYLGGRDMASMGAGEVARQLALLPQMQAYDVELVVEELVWRGRTPHQRFLRPATAEDLAAVDRAIEATNLESLRERSLRSLSGGERQRAWLALALAQDPHVLLLDEPTTFLDLRHQVELMGVLRTLSEGGLTVVAVLHDLGLASRYAERVIGILDGRVAFDGGPAEVLTPQGLEQIFGIPMTVAVDPSTGRPVPIPA